MALTVILSCRYTEQVTHSRARQWPLSFMLARGHASLVQLDFRYALAGRSSLLPSFLIGAREALGCTGQTWFGHVTSDLSALALITRAVGRGLWPTAVEGAIGGVQNGEHGKEKRMLWARKTDVRGEKEECTSSGTSGLIYAQPYLP